MQKIISFFENFEFTKLGATLIGNKKCIQENIEHLARTTTSLSRDYH